MRIAVITDSFPKLSETFVLNQITGLLDLGHDVHIFPAWHESDSKLHPDVTKYDLLSRTHRIPPTPANRLMRLFTAVMIFAGGFLSRPVRTWRLLRMLLAEPRDFSLRLLYFLSRFPDGFDAIHCHYGYNGLLAVRLRRLGTTGVIGTVFHGHDMSQFITANGPHVYDRLFAEGDVFLPISDRWRNRLMELGSPAEKTVANRMGIDLEKFRLQPRTLQQGEKVRLLCVARLAPTKGHEYLLRALARLLAAGRGVSLSVAGDGPLADQLNRLADELGLGEAVEFLGPVSQDQVMELMCQAHILVQPSVTAPDGDQEGIPVVLMEAMASGMPIISTFHSGIPELVEDGKTGCLVPERDVESLLHKLTFLIDNPHLWPPMGEAARQRITQFYNVAKQTPILANIYQDYLTRQRGAPDARP